MRAAIIDDLAVCREEITQSLSGYLDQNYTGTRLCAEAFESAEAFLRSFKADAYDLIFMDYYMDGMDGLAAAKAVRERDENVPILFITTSPDHAIDSYQVRACGYLLKPYTVAEFEQALSLAQIVKILDGQFLELAGERVLLREIVWFDQDGHYARIHTSGRGVLRIRMAFEELQALIAPYVFLQPCYRGCIVNLKRVKALGELSFLMDTGETVPFRQKDRSELERQYARFLFTQARGETK